MKSDKFRHVVRRVRFAWLLVGAIVGSAVLWVGVRAALAYTHLPHPSIVGVGCRYLAVTPQPWGAPVALQVAGMAACPDFSPSENVSCTGGYVQADGHLGSTPVYRNVSDWGTVYVHGPQIVPSACYAVRALESGHSGGPYINWGKTWKWGDADNNGVVNFIDVNCAVAGFQNGCCGGSFGYQQGNCSCYSADVAGSGCAPNHCVNFIDISAILDAFSGVPFPASCDPCP
jgi:hypothetical protein